MKIKKTEDALLLFISESIGHTTASTKGDYKAGNKCYSNIVLAASFLKANNAINLLVPLLEHNDIGVKLWAATYLLENSETKALEVLNDIVMQRDPHISFTAKMTISEWKSGEMKLVWM